MKGIMLIVLLAAGCVFCAAPGRTEDERKECARYYKDNGDYCAMMHGSTISQAECFSRKITSIKVMQGCQFQIWDQPAFAGNSEVLGPNTPLPEIWKNRIVSASCQCNP